MSTASDEYYKKYMAFRNANPELAAQVDELSSIIKIIPYYFSWHLTDEEKKKWPSETIFKEIKDNYRDLVDHYTSPPEFIWNDDWNVSIYTDRVPDDHKGENYYIWIHKRNRKHIPVFYQFLVSKGYIDEKFFSEENSILNAHYRFFIGTDR